MTDAGLRVEAGGITFNVGSTVFYTALLLGVFVIYVFDGPRTTRILISTIVGVSIMVPTIAFVLNVQTALIEGQAIRDVPMPSLRTFLTLLGVMWLDVLLFTTGAFLGTELFLPVLKGTLVSRLFISVAAFPLLYLYIQWESRRKDVTLENRPVFSILKQIADITEELHSAREEIERRKKAEAELQKALSEVKTLRGFIPICSGCKKIRDDQGYWEQIEAYIRRHSDAEFTHSLCPSCMESYYPELKEETNSSPKSD